MRMIAVTTIAAVFSFAVFSFGVSLAEAAAPAGALNKTVRISFAVSGSATKSDGTTIAFNNLNAYTIYTSENGRLFTRGMARSGQGRKVERSKESGPDDKGNAKFAFQGNRLVGVIQFAAGVRQVMIDFDSSFSSCTANVIDGRSAGGTIRRKSPLGEMVEVTSVSTGTPTCAIQSGNAFAN